MKVKFELKQVEDYVAGFKIPELKQTVNQNKQDLLDELVNKLATEQFNQKMTLIDNRFTINEQGINAAAKRQSIYENASRWTIRYRFLCKRYGNSSSVN
ncbi:hypothetical protein ACHWUR_00045 [Klebsiella pneumoniae]